MVTNTKNIFIIILVILILLMGGGAYYYYDKTQDMEVEIAIGEQNAIALNDSIQVTRNKVDDLEYSKSILIVQRDQLKKMNSILDSEVKKEKHKVSAMAATIITLNGKITELQGSVDYVPPTGEETDSTYKVNWHIFQEFDGDNNRRIGGYTTFGLDKDTFKLTNVKSTLTEDDIRLKLVQGLRERNGVVEIFARSEYPGFGVGDMHVAIIDPKTHPVLSKFTKSKHKAFGFAIYTGYGITYNFENTEALHGFQVGAGLRWSPKLF